MNELFTLEEKLTWGKITEHHEFPIYFSDQEFVAGSSGKNRATKETNNFDSRRENYSNLEVTLLRNGQLVIAIKVHNRRPLGLREIIKNIKRPEFTKKERRQANNQPDDLILDMQIIANLVQEKVAQELNELNITGFHIDKSSQLTLKLINVKRVENNQDSSTKKTAGLEVIDDNNNSLTISLEQKRSRPIIGVILNLRTNTAMQGEYRQLLLAAISLGRTTPEFMDIFKNPEEYMEGEYPKRNLFYPGNNILFIGRRAWACIMLDESRDLSSFYQGVIETSLFAIHSIISNVRAVRQYSMRLVEHGEMELYQDANNLVDEVNRANSFFRKAQRALPYEDMSNVLGTYFTSHTGIAAIKRLKYLTDYDNLIENAKSIMEKHNRYIQTLNLQLRARSMTKIANSTAETVNRLADIKTTISQHQIVEYDKD